MKKYLFMLLALVLITSIYTATTAAPKILTIGTIDCLTGPVSDQLGRSAEGERLAKQYINSKGGITIGGQKYLIELEQLDCQLNPQAAVTAANSLVSKNIKFIVGSFPDHIVRAIDSVAEQSKVIYVALNNSGGGVLTKDSKYQFLANVSTVAYYRVIASYLHELHPEVKTLGFAQADVGQTPLIAPGFKAMIKEYGMTVAGDLIPWSNDTVDFSPIVVKLMANNPDAIMLGNAGIEVAGSILKIARESGYTKPMCGLSLPMNEIIKVAGRTASTNFFCGSLPADPKDMPPVTQELFQLATGKVDIMNLLGFNGVYELVQAIEKAQSLDPTMVSATWEKMDTIETCFGTGKIGGMGLFGIRHAVYFKLPMSRAMDGKPSFRKWIEVSPD